MPRVAGGRRARCRDSDPTPANSSVTAGAETQMSITTNVVLERRSGRSRRRGSPVRRRPPAVRRSAGGGLDVLVETEDVAGVVAVLQRDEAIVGFDAVRIADAVGAFVADVVEVSLGGQMRFHRIPGLAGPVEGVVGVPRRVPLRGDEEVERR